MELSLQGQENMKRGFFGGDEGLCLGKGLARRTRVTVILQTLDRVLVSPQTWMSTIRGRAQEIVCISDLIRVAVRYFA